MRKAALIFESSRVAKYPLTADQSLDLSDWEQIIINMARDISREQTPARLQTVRNQLYDLLGHCVPGSVILR
jgi:replication factor C subunit 3/5